MWKNSRMVFLMVVLAFTLVLTACEAGGNDEKDDEESANNNGNIEIGQKDLIMPYVAWANSEAGVNVMKRYC